MPGAVAHLDTVGEVVEELRGLGLEPVLVGGMALVVLGSRRVTRDFDFVIAHPGDRLAATIDLFYDHGLELVSRLNDVGEVTSTIANRKVAASRLRLDAPATAYFLIQRPAFASTCCSTSPSRRRCSPNMRRAPQFARTSSNRLRAGSPASQEDRQSGAFGAGRRRGHCLSRVPPEALQIDKALELPSDKPGPIQADSPAR